MSLLKLGEEDLQRGAEKLGQIADAVKLNPAHRQVIAATAEYLRDSEEKLIAHLRGEEPHPDSPGRVEFGAVLHHLHQVSAFSGIDPQLLGLPEARLSEEHMALAQARGCLPRAASDGSLIGFGKWESFDPGWIGSLGTYILLKIGEIKLHPFAPAPKPVTLPAAGPITIAIVGDWGTGSWNDGSETPPSIAVMNQIVKLKPNYTIHLGDVYYAGTKAEEDANYVKFWQAATDGNFMLNSNHEMYDGANGYFDVGLADAPFVKQQSSSCFALMNDHVAIVGLDSAYGDTSVLFEKGGIPSNSPQIPYVKGLNLGNRKLIVLTHHNGLSTTGQQTTGLWQDMYVALGNRYPDIWYWGHIHNGIIYKPRTETVNGQEVTVLVRCSGHGAIPFGNGTGIMPPGYVTYYAHTPNPAAPPAGLRVMNGFTVLTIDGANVSEVWYDQDGNKAWP
jgi:hypothetical protein